MDIRRAMVVSAGAAIAFAAALWAGPVGEGLATEGHGGLSALVVPLVSALAVGGVVFAVSRNVSSGDAPSGAACPRCGGSVMAQWRLCPHCGTQLTHRTGPVHGLGDQREELQ